MRASRSRAVRMFGWSTEMDAGAARTGIPERPAVQQPAHPEFLGDRGRRRRGAGARGVQTLEPPGRAVHLHVATGRLEAAGDLGNRERHGDLSQRGGEARQVEQGCAPRPWRGWHRRTRSGRRPRPGPRAGRGVGVVPAELAAAEGQGGPLARLEDRHGPGPGDVVVDRLGIGGADEGQAGPGVESRMRERRVERVGVEHLQLGAPRQCRPPRPTPAPCDPARTRAGWEDFYVRPASVGAGRRADDLGQRIGPARPVRQPSWRSRRCTGRSA